jgi:hypothetical protein
MKSASVLAVTTLRSSLSIYIFFVHRVRSAGLLDIDFTIGSFLQKRCTTCWKKCRCVAEVLAHNVYFFR